MVSSSKRKQWSKVYESIMQKHMELCVDLKDNRLAKDGLHQYRNMVQNVRQLVFNTSPVICFTPPPFSFR